MALVNTGYNSVFKTFVDFAQRRVDANDENAIAGAASGRPLTARRIMAVKAAIDDVSKKALIANLPETMSIRAGGEVFKFDKWHYERMVEATPPAECPRTLAALKKHIAARIEHGQAIIRNVRAGRGDLPPAVPQARNLGREAQPDFVEYRRRFPFRGDERAQDALLRLVRIDASHAFVHRDALCRP